MAGAPETADRPLVARALAVASGAALGQVAILAGSFFLARWFFDPAEFGVLAALSGLATVIALVATLRLELAIQVPASDHDAAEVRAVARRFTIGVAALVTAGTAVLVTAGVASIGGSDVALLMLGPMVLAAALFNIEGFWAIRRGAFTTVARARAILGVATVVPQLIAGVVGTGVMGLVAGPLVGYATAAAYYVARSDHIERSETGTRSVLSAHRRFPMFSLWSALFNRGAIEVSSVLLLAVFDPAAAGIYFLCRRALLTPVNVINDSIYQSFLNHASDLARTDLAGLERLTHRTVQRLAAVVVIPTALAMVVAPQLLLFVFGETWTEVGELARYVLPYAAVTAVVIPVSSLTWVLGRHDLELLRNGGRFAAVLGVFAFAALTDASLTTTIATYCAVMALADASLLAIILRLVGQHRRSTSPVGAHSHG